MFIQGFNPEKLEPPRTELRHLEPDGIRGRLDLPVHVHAAVQLCRAVSRNGGAEKAEAKLDKFFEKLKRMGVAEFYRHQ
jgi:hypothetical protein